MGVGITNDLAIIKINYSKLDLQNRFKIDKDV